jgi:hypothetical protein
MCNMWPRSWCFDSFGKSVLETFSELWASGADNVETKLLHDKHWMYVNSWLTLKAYKTLVELIGWLTSNLYGSVIAKDRHPVFRYKYFSPLSSVLYHSWTMSITKPLEGEQGEQVQNIGVPVNTPVHPVQEPTENHTPLPQQTMSLEIFLQQVNMKLLELQFRLRMSRSTQE